MRNFAKKFISGLTTLSMCASMFVGISVSAADPTPVAPTINRKLSVEFMGRGSTPRDSSPGKARLTADDIGNEFWVGVAVDKVNDLDLFTNGVYSLEVAFEYNPNFLEPYTTSTDPDNEWQNELISGNMKSGTNDSAWWDSSQYEIISVRSTDIDTLHDREDLAKGVTRASAGWKMCTVCVTFNITETFANARFDGLTDDGKQYLLKLPFKLKAVPAEADADQNPTVLSLVRGPETLDIGSGTDGTDPYSAWEATVTDWTDQTNMKTLFSDNGDISLFDSGGSVSDIIPVKPMTGEETSDTNYTLSTSNLLQEEGFDGETYVYYLSVPNETEKIRLDITSSDLPTVNANGTAVTATLDSGQLYKTDEFNLLELNKDTDNGGEADGFNNTVTVEAGGTTYTIHIRRLLKPKIVLNPGNSPYGLIQQDDVTFPTQAAKDDAKKAFNDSHAVNKTYGAGKVPVGGETAVKYSVNAWKNVNYDLVDEAIFVYQENKFKDPGFKVYDEFGELKENAVVDREVCFKTLRNSGLPKYFETDAEENAVVADYQINIPSEGSEYVFNVLKNKMVRPDVYTMKYTYNYIDSISGLNRSLKIERPIIVISARGDIEFTVPFGINYNDYSYFKNNWGSIESYNTEGGRIFAYRIADMELTTPPGINYNDTSYLKNNWGSEGYFKKFYKPLPEE